ncbi:MAG: hypothetical protein AAGG50_20220, partial [Bacteroidota bacterium]
MLVFTSLYLALQLFVVQPDRHGVTWFMVTFLLISAGQEAHRLIADSQDDRTNSAENSTAGWADPPPRMFAPFTHR